MFDTDILLLNIIYSVILISRTLSCMLISYRAGLPPLLECNSPLAKCSCEVKLTFHVIEALNEFSKSLSAYGFIFVLFLLIYAYIHIFNSIQNSTKQLKR